MVRHAPQLRRAAACAAAVAFTATACSGATATTTTTAAATTTTTRAPRPRPRLTPLFGPRLPLPLALHHVTRDRGTDRYDLHQDGNGVIVEAAATNRSTPKGSATRAVIWAPRSLAVRDATTCATWARSEPWGQEGLALRIAAEGNRFRAIVIAKNTVFGASWQFNVYSWDSAREPYFMTHGSVDLSPVFTVAPGQPEPLPWRVCARTEGALVRIKGWDTNEAQPGWSVPGHGGTVELSQDLTYDGRAGWYAAHIEPGDVLALAELRAYARSADR